ncbi:CD209 antigen-like protein E isoform X2 [Hypomesus transpacificus]|uniref:CD209 antigen-like protein E isoform X2 n=1 Tax=Hypomesus transpacificus TaxID=137520 RepID=UPI001F07151F|nr:CD209 antigen-like protein E isoform X2 [Hypomesus transpacificus]
MDTSGNTTYSNEERVYENPFSSGEEANMGEEMYINYSVNNCHDKVAIKTIQKGPGPGPGAVVPLSSLWRAAAVCLGLLCALLLAGVIALGVIFTRVNEDKTIKTMERDQLQTNYTDLSRERDQLQTSNTNLTRERDDLKRRLCDLTSCSAGWPKFGCSCYYVSNEMKNWTDSRQDCLRRGADLVIINSHKEQEFLNNFTKRVWIGLSDTVTEGNFTWVDGTPLTTPTYWFSPQPDNHLYKGNVNEDCAEIYYPSHSDTKVGIPKTWNDNRCDFNNSWVCERGI